MNYPGLSIIFGGFLVTFLILLFLVLPRPRLYVYTFVAGLLALGFLGKVLLHLAWPIDFLEPVGSFRGKPEEWDDALLAGICGALGAIVVRAAHLLYWRRRGGNQEDGQWIPAPAWYVRWRKQVWSATLIVATIIYAANLHFAFFQIGMNPKLILPFRINVLLAWLVNIGFALWVATLMWWAYRQDRTSLKTMMLAPMLEGYFSSVSTFSRIAYPIHAGPHWLSLWEMRRIFRDVLTRSRMFVLVGYFIVLFSASAVSVFALRIVYYTASTPGTMRLGPSLTYELPRLFLQRWVGLEGVLTVSAVDTRGGGLFLRAITDDAARGPSSLYQTLAKVKPNSEPEKFTFLTNAGPIAILWLSGSLSVVFIGMALCVLALFITEEINRKVLRNPFLLAVSGASLANVFCQTTFPYLSLIFLLQTWVAVVFLSALERSGSRRMPKP